MNKKASIRLVFGVYAAMLILALAASLFTFAVDSVRFASGALTTTSLNAQTMVLKDFEILPNNNLRATSPDPQIIINNQNAYAAKITFDIAFSAYPGEVNLYYTYGDEDFTDKQKIWGKAKNDGSYEFVLPRGKLSQIRVDPTNFIGVELDIKSFILNPKTSLSDYFKYNGEQVFVFALTGVFIICFIACIIDANYTAYDKLRLKAKGLLAKAKNRLRRN